MPFGPPRGNAWRAFLLHVFFEVVLVHGIERELVGLFDADAVGEHQLREAQAVDQHDPPVTVTGSGNFRSVQKC